MNPQKQLSGEVWGMLQKIKRIISYPPSNHPLMPDAYPLFEIEVGDIEEFRNLTFLHHEKAIVIENPEHKGFGLGYKFPLVVMFALGDKFEGFYADYSSKHGGNNQDKVTVRLSKKDTSLVLETPEGEFEIHSFRPDSYPDRIFNFLMNHADKEIPVKTLKLEADVTGYKLHSPSEIARHAGFTPMLKSHFMPSKSNAVVLHTKLEISRLELKQIIDQLSQHKS